MSDESQIDELLARWDALVQSGREPSPRDLAPDAPELWDELQRRIAYHRKHWQDVDDPREPSPPAIARLPCVPGFELRGPIGNGGQATVYRAINLHKNREVALKVFQGPAPAQQRIRREAQAIPRLDHPNIVKLFSAGEYAGGFYLELEYVAGGDLRGHRAELKENPKAAAQLLAGTARAVHYLHEQGILHRDLKPSNVLITGDGHPKVVDFGLAKGLAGAASRELTNTGEMVGTIEYMAPEQLESSRQASRVSDVYSLGCILYELLTARSPFHSNSAVQTVLLIRSGEVRRPRTICAGIPADLEKVCLKCLAHDPRDRYASAAALADDLDRFIAGRRVKARLPGKLRRLARWTVNHRKAAALSLAAAALVLALAGWEFQAQRRRAANVVAEEHLAKAEKRRKDPVIGRRLESLREIANGVRRLNMLPGGPTRKPERQLLQRFQDAALASLPYIDLTETIALELPPLEIISWDRQLKRCAVNERAVDGENWRVGIYSRDQPTARPLYLPPIPLAHGAVDSGFNFDGRLLAANYRLRDEHGNDTHKNFGIVWDIDQRQALLRRPGRLMHRSFHPDRDQVCFAAPGGPLEIRDVRANTTLHEWDLRQHGNDVTDARFSPDGLHLAVAFSHQAVVVVNVESGKTEQVIPEKPSDTAQLAWSPDGRRLAIGQIGGQLTEWDVANQRIAHRWQPYDDGVPVWLTEYAATPDVLASVASGGMVHLWDTASGELLLCSPGNCMKFGENGELAVHHAQRWKSHAIVPAREVTRCDIRSRGAGHGFAQVSSVSFHPHDAVAAVASNNGISLWNYRNGMELYIVDDQPAHSVGFRPDGTALLALGPTGIVQWSIDRRIDGEGRRAWTIGQQELFANLSGIHFSQLRWLNEQHLAVLLASPQNPAELHLLRRDAVSLMNARKFKMAQATNLAVGPAPSGPDSSHPFPKWLAVSDWGSRRVDIVDPSDTTNRVRSLGVDEAGKQTAAEFSPDGRLLVSVVRGDAQPVICAWKTDDWQPAWTVPCGPSSSYAVPRFFADGKMLVVGSHKDRFIVIDASTGEQRAAFHRDRANNPLPMAISPDQRTVAVMIDGGLLDFWHFDRVRDQLHQLGLSAVSDWLPAFAEELPAVHAISDLR